MRNEATLPWQLDCYFQEILAFASNPNIVFQPVYRELNSVVDSLANHGCILIGVMSYHNISDLSRQAKVCVLFP